MKESIDEKPEGFNEAVSSAYEHAQTLDEKIKEMEGNLAKSDMTTTWVDLWRNCGGALFTEVELLIHKYEQSMPANLSERLRSINQNFFRALDSSKKDLDTRPVLEICREELEKTLEEIKRS
jgi:hypothetical protein